MVFNSKSVLTFKAGVVDHRALAHITDDDGGIAGARMRASQGAASEFAHSPTAIPLR